MLLSEIMQLNNSYCKWKEFRITLGSIKSIDKICFEVNGGNTCCYCFISVTICNHICRCNVLVDQD